jgi:hypothetical protein
MPDWQKLVDGQLAGLVLEPVERADVIAELAAHLEESYERFRQEGLLESEAAHRALAQVTDWNDLRRKIRAARSRKDTMTNRITQLWLPGFLTFVLSTGIFELFEIFGPKPWIVARSGDQPLLVFQMPWLLSLPLVGAMGAYLSWRAGGSQRVMLSSVVFPVLPFLASILVVLPFSLFFDHFIGHSSAPMAGLMALIGFVLAPGVALLAGGLPIQFFLSRSLASR